ncbi:MAG TPA: hypothetical protein VKW06_03110 [Candidatus Angelobacter sp.]|nr:hypothetical protein [Candidatus Angelobacter sp.]
MTKHVLMLVVLLAPPVNAKSQDNPDYLCARELPVENVVRDSPLGAKGLTFFGSVENSAGHIELFNTTSKTIQYYLLLVDLLDSDGTGVLSVPVFNVDKQQKIPFKVNFSSWILSNWPGAYFEPISPGSTARKVFVSPLTTLTCPVKARISAVQIRYSDGTEFRSAPLPLNLPPVLSEASLTRTKECQRWSPLTSSGVIRVDPEGHGQLEMLDFENADLRNWLEAQIVAWKFSPASQNGDPAQGNLPFLLVIGDIRTARSQLDLLKQKGRTGTILLVAVVPPELSSKRAWTLIAGGLVR